MEQIEQLFEILKETPEMALWGVTIFFLFKLLKLASWVFALKVVIQLGINRWHDVKMKHLEGVIVEAEQETEALKQKVEIRRLDYEIKEGENKVKQLEQENKKALIPVKQIANRVYGDDFSDVA